MNISIVLCTYNRVSSLIDTLKSLDGMYVPSTVDWEVLVVDNNSSDDTMNVVTEFINDSRSNFRYIFESTQGKSFALNQGVSLAKGEIIAFIDDDVLVDKNWISCLLECFKIFDCDGVGGRVLPMFTDETPKWVLRNKDLLEGPIVIYDYGEASNSYDECRHVPFIGANMAYRKSCFEKNGFFRTDIGPGTSLPGEDTEFFNRVNSENSKLYYCGKALVWHTYDEERVNLRYLSQWYKKAGRFSALFDENSEAVKYFGVPRHLFKSLFFSTILFVINFFYKRNNLKYRRSIIWNFEKIRQYIEIENSKNGVSG